MRRSKPTISLTGFNCSNKSCREFADFGDQADIAANRLDSVKRLYEAGVVGGRDGNVFDPKGATKRLELAIMIKLLIEAGN